MAQQKQTSGLLGNSSLGRQQCSAAARLLEGGHIATGLPWWQLAKNLPAVQETQVPSLGWEDPLEKEMATHSRTLAWEIPEEPGMLQSMGSQDLDMT